MSYENTYFLITSKPHSTLKTKISAFLYGTLNLITKQMQKLYEFFYFLLKIKS